MARRADWGTTPIRRWVEGLLNFRSDDPVYGGHAGHSVVVADPLCQQPVPDLPGKHGGVLPLVLGDLVHHFGGRHFGLGAPNHPGLDAARLVVPAQDLADTTMADPQLPGDVTGPHPLVRQLHYPLPHHVREGPPVHEHPSELVHSPVPWVHGREGVRLAVHVHGEAEEGDVLGCSRRVGSGRELQESGKEGLPRAAAPPSALSREPKDELSKKRLELRRELLTAVPGARWIPVRRVAGSCAEGRQTRGPGVLGGAQGSL